MNATVGEALDAGGGRFGCVAVNATTGRVFDAGGARTEGGDGIVPVVVVGGGVTDACFSAANPTTDKELDAGVARIALVARLVVVVTVEPA